MQANLWQQPPVGRELGPDGAPDHPRSQSTQPTNSLTKNSSFCYFTLDDMGLRLLKLLLDDTYLFAFQRYLLQNGVCQPSMMPGYLSSLDMLSDFYSSGRGKKEAALLDRGTFFACQMDVLKKCCNIGPSALVIPDHWLLEFDANGGGEHDE